MEKFNDLSNDKIRILKRLKNIGQEMTEEDKTEQNGRNDSGNLEASPSSSKIGISNINAIIKGEVDSEDSESHSLTSSLEFLHKEFDRNSNYSKRTPKIQENLKHISENSNQSNETVIRKIKSYLSKSNLDSKKKQKLFQNLFLTFKNLLEEEKNKETSDERYNYGTENQSLKLKDSNADSVINKHVNILQAEENGISSTFESKEWCKQSSGNEVKLKNLMNVEKHNLTKPKLPRRKKFEKNNDTSENSESSSDTAKNQETVVYKNSELSVLPLSKQPTPFYHIGKNILSINTETVPSIYGNKGKNLKSVILKIEPTDAEDNSQPVRIEVSQVSPEEKNFKNSSIRNVLAPFTKEDTNVILLPSENRELTQEMVDTTHVPLTNYKYVSKQSSTIFPINKILASGGLMKKPTVIAISATEDLQERKISENGSTILIAPPLREFQNLNVEEFVPTEMG
ncbi:interaptin-like [Centruroides vittatus]|uniref:interaptin-like n=1 Tax=Centruroides vittatus TaxID=120091 RepID=UPI00350FE0D9